MAEFYKPNNLLEALELLEKYDDKAAVVNGGSDIIIDISKKKISPEAIIYINDLPEIKSINESEDSVVIGGAVTYDQMQNNAVCSQYAGLMKAISSLGSPAVRSVATPAGNIGTAAPAADCATMLLALKSIITVKSVNGERMVPLKDFYLGRNRTVLKKNELITAIIFPGLRAGDGTGYCKVARRKAQDIGKVLVGTYVNIEGDILKDVAISLGALNASIVRANSLEDAIRGKRIDEAKQYLEETFPQEAGLRDSYFRKYKESVTRAVILKSFSRAVEDAMERRQGQSC